MDLRTLTEFQNSHVLPECVQLLEDAERAGSHAQHIIWQQFVAALAATPDIKSWCDTLLGHLHLHGDISPERVGRLVNLSAVQMGEDEASVLQDLQAYLVSSVEHYTELKRQDEASMSSQTSSRKRIRQHGTKFRRLS